MPRMQLCPRCAAHSYEVLSTHAYCVNCNYSPEFKYLDSDFDVPKWAIDAANELDESEKKEEERKAKNTPLVSLAMTAGFLFFLSGCGLEPENQDAPKPTPVTPKRNVELKGDIREVPYLKNVGRLTLAKDTRVFIGNRDLEIEADEIVSNGAVIQAFEGQKTPFPVDGRNAGGIAIRAVRASGRLVIIASGENGVNGADGKDGANGHQGPQGVPGVYDVKPDNQLPFPCDAKERARLKAYYSTKTYNDPLARWDLWFFCSQQTGNGFPGLNGADGADGERGGNGGNSSQVLVSIQENSPFQVEITANPGEPGLPGRGGLGGKGGPGGIPGVQDNGHMCRVAGSGSEGNPGKNGRTGRHGEPGKKNPACFQNGSVKSYDCRLFQ